MDTTNLLFQKALAEARAKKLEVAQVVPPQKMKPKLDVGTYLAVVTDAKYQPSQPSTHGIQDKVRVTFTVSVNDEVVTINKNYWFSSKNDSEYVIHLENLLGYSPIHGFHLNDLIGNVVEITISHFTTEKGTFSTVSGVQKTLNDELVNHFII